jgi:hypothetical protein
MSNADTAITLLQNHILTTLTADNLHTYLSEEQLDLDQDIPKQALLKAIMTLYPDTHPFSDPINLETFLYDIEEYQNSGDLIPPLEEWYSIYQEADEIVDEILKDL